MKFNQSLLLALIYHHQIYDIRIFFGASNVLYMFKSKENKFIECGFSLAIISGWFLTKFPYWKIEEFNPSIINQHLKCYKEM